MVFAVFYIFSDLLLSSLRLCLLLLFACYHSVLPFYTYTVATYTTFSIQLVLLSSFVSVLLSFLLLEVLLLLLSLINYGYSTTEGEDNGDEEEEDDEESNGYDDNHGYHSVALNYRSHYSPSLMSSPALIDASYLL